MSEQPIVCLPEFGVIKLTGEDAYSFLQGQVTCDVLNLKEQEFVPGCHCNAKGKMWSTFIAVANGDDILLIMSKSSLVFSLAELSKYGVFAKVDINDDSESWSIYGTDSVDGIDTKFQIQLAEQHYLLLSDTKVNAATDNKTWWKNEILSGRAHLSAGLEQEYIPQMLNVQALDYISFSKGCYMGQEMVARTRYLGRNKRALYLAEIEQEVELESGADIAIELNGNKRNIGKIIQSTQYQGKTYLQLVLPNDTALTEILYTSAQQPLKLLELPYSLD